jgi:hypothetical protein
MIKFMLKILKETCIEIFPIFNISFNATRENNLPFSLKGPKTDTAKEVKMGLFVYLARIARLLRQFKVELLLQSTLTHQHSAVLLYDN